MLQGSNTLDIDKHSKFHIDLECSMNSTFLPTTITTWLYKAPTKLSGHAYVSYRDELTLKINIHLNE